MYYLFDFERGMWWKRGEFGYTENVEEAQIFSFEAAKRKTMQANMYEGSSRLPNTAMVPTQDYRIDN